MNQKEHAVVATEFVFDSELNMSHSFLLFF